MYLFVATLCFGTASSFILPAKVDLCKRDVQGAAFCNFFYAQASTADIAGPLAHCSRLTASQKQEWYSYCRETLCGHPEKLCNVGGNVNGACNAERERSGEPQIHPATMFSQLRQTESFDNATRAAFAACADYYTG